MRDSELKVVSTRITKPLARALEEYLRIDAHVSPADFIRDAIREKLKRDAPSLYEKC
jgi:Arc/MetJ-type ribon-helix-helix transcriptional regulator